MSEKKEEVNPMNRFRLFSCLTYLEKNDLLSFLTNFKNCRNYAFIYHDKDINVNGALVEPHTHLLLRLNNPCTCSALRKQFPTKPNTFVEHIVSDNIVNYLTHKGFEDKFQYDESEIVSNDIDYWFRLSIGDDDNSKCINLINDINSGVDFYTLMCTYGRDFVLNYKKYCEFARLVCPPPSAEEFNNICLSLVDHTEIARSFEQMPLFKKD